MSFIINKLLNKQADQGNLRIFLEGKLYEAGAGLSRIMRFFTGKVSNVDSAVIISASRDAGNPKMSAENSSRTKALMSDVRKLGLGYVKAVGIWIENEGTPEERKVKEKSLIIPNMTLEQGRKLAKKYDQEAFIHWDRSGNKIRAYDAKGKPQAWSKWSKMQFNLSPKDIQTQVKGDPKKSFAFAASQEPDPHDLEFAIGETNPEIRVKGRGVSFGFVPKGGVDLKRRIKEFLNEEFVSKEEKKPSQ